MIGTRLVMVTAVAAASTFAAPAVAATQSGDARVKRGLERIVAADGGPPGAIATLYRDGRLRVLTAGVSRTGTRRAPRASDHMRLASVAKAFSGAIALQLVEGSRLGLDDTIAQHPTELPAAWSRVTVRQLLNHTGGVPDYTQSAGFRKQFQTSPRGFVSPRKIISWVADQRLDFTPGTRFEYSNTDNIIVGLIAERITAQPYGDLLQTYVFDPLGLAGTSFPTVVRLPRPFIHGYLVEPGQPPQDVSEFLSPSGAWASGAVVSTPANLNTFIRGVLGGRLFGPAARQGQNRNSSPAGARARRAPGATARGSRSSATAAGVARSTGTQATSRAMSSGRRPPATARVP